MQEKSMLVFIDESGDPGFELAKGSTPYFVVAMVIFETTDAAEEARLKIMDLAAEYGIKPEFKFNKSRNLVRDAFFTRLSNCRFKVRAIIVEKQFIRAIGLRENKESFYKFFLRQLVQHDGGMLNNAKLVIDGSGDREFKSQLMKYLRRSLDPSIMARVDLKDSVRDSLIQLADMCAGAIGRSCRADKADASRWRDMLHANAQIANIWNFR
jgi:hypothetical protein